MSDPIDEALAALVRKYPMALRIPDAIAHVAALTATDGPAVHRAVDRLLQVGSLHLGDDYRLTLPGAVPNPRRPPLPLTSPDGRVFGWACAHCLRIGRHGEPMSADQDERRNVVARISLAAASNCGDCFHCKVFQPEHDTFGLVKCPACEAAQEAQRPKGEMVPCDDCKGTGEIGVVRAGEALSVQCPTCEGDGQVWRAES